MKGSLSVLALILTWGGAGVVTWGGAGVTWVTRDDLFLYGIGAFGVGIVLSVVVGFWEKDFKAILRALLPAIFAVYNIATYTGFVSFADGELTFGDTCRVSTNESMEGATRFDKSCSDLTQADIYWTAGVGYGSRYYYRGTGSPPITFNGCRIGLSRESIGDPEGTTYFAKPCEELTDADRDKAGVQPGRTYYYWDWD